MGSSIVFDILANDRASSKFGAVGTAMDKTGDKAGKLSGVLKGAATVGFGALTAAAGIAGAALAAALDQEKSSDRLAASLGATPKVAEKYGKIAGNLYAGAWGESMDDVNHAVESVASSFEGLGKSGGLEKVTAQALDFAAIFEVDVPRATSVAATVMKAGLAKSATEAFDLMTAASQKVPAALREDVMDASEEYSQFFDTLGFSGSQAFGVLVKGAEKGMYGIDKAGDAIKEFTIRSTDMSAASQTAYESIGLDAEAMTRSILAGGDRSSGAFNKIIDGILGIKDPAKQAQTALALFGTPLEDLNVKDIPEFLTSLQDGAKSLGDFRGAIDKAGGTLNDNAATNIESFKRQVTQTFVDLIGGKVIPVLGDFSAELASDVGPAMGDAADAAKSLAGFIDDIPGPVKDIGVQAAIAALALWKINGAMIAVRDSKFATTMMDATARTDAFKAAARGAAGVGGLLALSHGMQEADYSTRLLTTTLGGAAAGFAVGGPWGAAAGAVGGLALGLSSAGGAAEVTFHKFELLRDTLDKTTGAMTEFSRTAVAESLRAQGDALDQDFIAIADNAGISLRTLTDAALGNDRAMGRVMAHFKNSGDLVKTASGWYAQEQGVQDLLDVLGILQGDLRHSQREIRANARASQELAGELDGIPRDVKTHVQEVGVPVTIRGLAKLATEYKNLDNKQIRTLIEAANLPFTVKQIRDLQAELDETDKKRPKPKIDADINPFQARDKTVRGLIGGLDKEKPTPKADLDLSAFYQARGTLLTSLNTIPDEDVNIWLWRKPANGDPSGGGADLGHANGTASAPAGWAWVGEQGPELMRFKGGEQVVPHHKSVAMAAAMRTAFSNVQSASVGTSAMYAASPRRVVHVVRVEVVPGEMDLSKAKVQIDGVAREVFAEEFAEERRFERTQR